MKFLYVSSVFGFLLHPVQCMLASMHLTVANHSHIVLVNCETNMSVDVGSLNVIPLRDFSLSSGRNNVEGCFLAYVILLIRSHFVSPTLEQFGAVQPLFFPSHEPLP